jgi:hypothetical protein
MSRARNAIRPTIRIELQPLQVTGRDTLRRVTRGATIEAVSLSKNCLDTISDPELRRIIEAILFAAAAGGLLGIAVGSLAGCAACVHVGALVGVGVGMAAASVALGLTMSREPKHA